VGCEVAAGALPPVVAVTTPPAAGPAAAALLKRAATAVVGIPLFVWIVTLAPRALFVALVVALSGIAAWELTRMFERAGRRVYARVGVVGSMLVTVSFAPTSVPGLSALALALAVAGALSVPVWAGDDRAVDAMAATTLAIVYVGWLLGYGIAFESRPDGAALVLFLVGATWAGESAAYAVGSLVGRHQLAPAISPRKTVEGAVGQLLVSTAAGAGLGSWLLPDWSLWTAALAGAMLGVVGQIGDLVESVVKRSLGAKDTGGLIPGHGGVLDRVDGLMFNAPALFYYASFVGGRG
jgi:phosphatidate cytidylyltransferase